MNGWKSLTILASRSILDVWHGFEYGSEFYLEVATRGVL